MIMFVLYDKPINFIVNWQKIINVSTRKLKDCRANSEKHKIPVLDPIGTFHPTFFSYWKSI